jgi:predicted nucleic acid-binding protein
VTAYLLEVNVLIALLSRKQYHHRRACIWSESKGHQDWLTCPTAQNRAIRIMSGAGFPNVTVTPGKMVESVQSLTAVGSHRFIPDQVSLRDGSLAIPSRMLVGNPGTDMYLLALAARNGAMLAPFDHGVTTGVMVNGAASLLNVT